MRLQLMIRRAKASQGLEWIRVSFRLLLAQPALGALALVLMMVPFANLIPFAGILVVLVMPFLQAGFYQAIVHAQQQQPVKLATLFAPFERKELRVAFLRLSGAKIVVLLPALLCFEPVISAVAEARTPEPLLVFAAVMCMALYSMLFAYSEAIIYFLGETRLLPVMLASLNACWRNVPSLLVFGMLATLLAMTIPFTMGISFFMIGPLLAIAFFQSFRDFFVLTPERVKPEEGTFEV